MPAATQIFAWALNEIGVRFVFGVQVARAANRAECQTALKQAFSSEGTIVTEAVVGESGYNNLVLKPNK
ncbi:MAG: hypothetical protein FD181_344 [Prolixibacteraceae bacterium]|nr:MAG: hypothetical protein FD181_344 [Prolixibacteraceae bacterium]